VNCGNVSGDSLDFELQDESLGRESETSRNTHGRCGVRNRGRNSSQIVGTGEKRIECVAKSVRLDGNRRDQPSDRV
jgi:hypothetical protein